MGESGPQWWLLKDGAPAGPYPHADVIRELQTGRLSRDALASPVGTIEWRPLGSWECFAGGAHDEPEAPPRQTPWTFDVKERPATHRASPLPDMARWICNYGLFVSPVLWLINQASCLAPSIFAENSPLFGFDLLMKLAELLVSLAVAVLLFVGAIWLRQGKRNGVWLLISGLSLDVGWFVLCLLVMALVMTAAAHDAGQQHLNPNDGGHPELGLTVCAIDLAAGVFEVVSLVWLLTKRRELRLT